MNEERRRQLARYFDGELPAQECDRIEGELDGDPAAVCYLEQLRLLRKLARQHDPCAAMPLASPLVARPWRRVATQRRRALHVAAAAAALLGLIWSAHILHSMHGRNRATTAPTLTGKKSPDLVDSTKSEARVSPAPTAVPPSLELDAQRFAWANGELTSPATAARIVLDSQPRRGSRSSNVEILAIELAHTPPETMREAARTLVERSTSIRSPAHPPPGHKAPTPTPSPPRRSFLERDQRNRHLIASPDTWYAGNRPDQSVIVPSSSAELLMLPTAVHTPHPQPLSSRSEGRGAGMRGVFGVVLQTDTFSRTYFG